MGSKPTLKLARKSHDYYSLGYVAKQPIPGGSPPQGKVAALAAEVERLTVGLERIRETGTWRPSSSSPDGSVCEGEPRMHMLAGMADEILKGASE